MNAPRSHRRTTAVVATSLLLALTAGCSQTGAATSSESAGDPVAGGVLNVGLNTSVACIDTHQNASNVPIFVARQLADGLTDQDPETGEIVPWLAESWEVDPDATTYTFHLRSGVTFSDGTPLDAEVVKGNFDTIVALGPSVTPLASTYLQGYSGAEVVDPSTVVVSFSQPNVQFLQGTATITLGIFSRSTLAKTAAERCNGGIVGTGPFTIESYSPEQEIVLTKRDGYDWASSIYEHTGEAYVDTVRFTVVPEASVRSGQLRSGELHVDTIPLTEDVPTFEGNGFGVVGRPYPGVAVNLVPNLERPLTSDVNIRKAVLLGTDREEIVAGVLTEYDQPATNVITSATPLFEPAEVVEHDPEAAKTLLEESGWTEGADGIREKDGQKLTLLAIYHASRQSGPVMELLQSQLRDVGIDLQIRLDAPADLAASQASGEWDLWYTPFHRAEADSVRAVFGFDGRNQNRATEPRPVDALLTAQSEETDPVARQALVAEATQALVDDAYAIPLFELAGVMTFADVVQGFHFEASSRLSLYDVWLSDQS